MKGIVKYLHCRHVLMQTQIQWRQGLDASIQKSNANVSNNYVKRNQNWKQTANRCIHNRPALSHSKVVYVPWHLSHCIICRCSVSLLRRWIRQGMVQQRRRIANFMNSIAQQVKILSLEIAMLCICFAQLCRSAKKWCRQHYQLSEVRQSYLNSMSQAGIKVIAVQRLSSNAHGLDWCHVMLSCDAPLWWWHVMLSHRLHTEYMYRGTKQNLAAEYLAKKFFHM